MQQEVIELRKKVINYEKEVYDMKKQNLQQHEENKSDLRLLFEQQDSKIYMAELKQKETKDLVDTFSMRLNDIHTTMLKNHH